MFSIVHTYFYLFGRDICNLLYHNALHSETCVLVPVKIVFV